MRCPLICGSVPLINNCLTLHSVLDSIESSSSGGTITKDAFASSKGITDVAPSTSNIIPGGEIPKKAVSPLSTYFSFPIKPLGSPFDPSAAPLVPNDSTKQANSAHGSRSGSSSTHQQDNASVFTPDFNLASLSFKNPGPKAIKSALTVAFKQGVLPSDISLGVLADNMSLASLKELKDRVQMTQQKNGMPFTESELEKRFESEIMAKEDEIRKTTRKERIERVREERKQEHKLKREKQKARKRGVVGGAVGMFTLPKSVLAGGKEADPMAGDENGEMPGV